MSYMNIKSKVVVLACMEILLIGLLIAACASRGDEVLEFEEQEAAEDVHIESLAAFVMGYDEVTDAQVQTDGDRAVVAVSLAHEYGGDEVVLLKRRLSKDIMAAYPALSHVAISTAPDAFKEVTGQEEDVDKYEPVEEGLFFPAPSL